MSAGSVYAIDPQRVHVADGPVVDPLDDLFPPPRMPPHEAGRHLEVLPLRLRDRLEHAAHSRRVDRERLLHEHVHPFLHGVFEVQRAEGGGGGEHGDVAGPQAVDGLLVGVEAQEHPLRRNVDLVAEHLLQPLVAPLLTLFEDVGHGVQFDRAAGRGERVGHRARAAIAAAHQGQADGVVCGGMAVGHGHARQGRRGSHPSRRFQELATRRRSRPNGRTV